MTTVYIVATGEYSDRHILAVFLDKDMAQRYLAIAERASSSARMEEFVDGETPEGNREVLAYWVSEVKLSTGEITEGQPSFNGRDLGPWYTWKNDDGCGLGIPTMEYHRRCTFLQSEMERHFGNDLRIASLESQEHANKLAAELRQHVLRLEQAGIVEPIGHRKANWRIKAIPKEKSK